MHQANYHHHRNPDDRSNRVPAAEGLGDSMENSYRIDENDAILEKDVYERLNEYLSVDNNSLGNAGEKLAKSYLGIPDMIQILLNWSVTFTDDPTDLLRRATENSLLEMESTLLPNINNSLRKSDFSMPGLNEINESSIWKPFFLEMANRSSFSILPQAFIRQDQFQATGINKLSFSSPKEFSHQFESLFLSLNSNSINTQDFMDKFISLCTYDECTMKSSIYILNYLSIHSVNPLTRYLSYRLIQNIRNDAITQLQSIGTAPPTHAALPSRSLTEEECKIYIAKQSIQIKCTSYNCQMRKEIIDSLIKIVLSKCDVGDFRDIVNLDREIGMITDIYSTLIIGTIKVAGEPLGNKLNPALETLKLNPITVDEKCIYIRILNDELLLASLIEASFSVHRKPSKTDVLKPNKKRVLVLLLSYCKTFYKYDDKKLINKLKSSNSRKKLCTEISNQFNQILLLISTCEQLKPGCALYQIKEEMETLIKACKDPFLSRGLLTWTIEGLKGGSNLRDLRKTCIYHLSFLSMLADHHPCLHPKIINILKNAMLRADYNDLKDVEIIEIKEKIIKCMSGLIKLGLGLPLLQLYLNHFIPSASIDISHLRTLLLDILNFSSPPYSERFVVLVRKFAHSQRLRSAMNENLEVALQNFERHCSEIA